MQNQSVNTRMNTHLEMLLMPLRRIADSVGRVAEAVERIIPATSPATPPPSTGSSPSTRSMTTLCSDAPGPAVVLPACETEEEDCCKKKFVPIFYLFIEMIIFCY